MATHVELLLQILEGSNFHLLDPDSTLIFKGILDRVTLSSDPIPVSSTSGLRLEIGEEMIWKMSQRSYKRIKMTKALKLECFNVTASGAKINIGYIIMSLKAVTDSSTSTLGWRRLLGSNMSSHNCPQLHISLSVKDEKADTQRALSPPVILETSNNDPQLFVKNGMTYIGTQRFCTKRFQFTCVLKTASNLDLLMSEKNSVKNKKFYIQVLVLGQPLISSIFEYPVTRTDFNQTFVFDVMSSEDILGQYLKENLSLEVSIISEDVSHGSCKQYVDSLQPGNTVQLTCYITQDGMNSRSKTSDYPSVELALSLTNLDDLKQNSNVPVKVVTPRLIEIDDDQNDSSNNNSKKTMHGTHVSTPVPELIDLTNESVVIEEACSFTPKLENKTPHSEKAENNQENSNVSLDLNSIKLSNVAVATTVNVTEESELVVSQNIRQMPAHGKHEQMRNEAQDSLRSAGGSSDPELNLNLVGLKFKENQCSGKCNCSTRLSNSELLAKCVEELEEWKFREKILFAEELKQQKEQLVIRWEEEQKVRAEVQEKAREEEVKHAEQLTAQLDQDLRTMHHKVEELTSEEEKFKKLSTTLQEKYARKVKAHQAQMKDAKTKLEAMLQRNKQLQQQIGILQHENQRLLRKSQGSESAQLSDMKEQVRILEKKMLKTEREKEELVRKWIISQQEGRLVQNHTASSSSQRLNVPGKSSKHRLQQTLEEERNQLLSEKHRLEQLRHELDNLKLICTSETEAGIPDNISDAPDISHSHLRRLQHERNDLLHSGLYSQDHEIIKQIEKAIQHMGS